MIRMLGGLVGGLIATTDRPSTFTVLFLGDAATFLVFAAVVLAFVPSPTGAAERAQRIGSYADVLRNRVFVGVIALNFVFIAAGMAQLESLPVYAKNEAGVTERGIGFLFFVNTLVVVLAQLPPDRSRDTAECERLLPWDSCGQARCCWSRSPGSPCPAWVRSRYSLWSSR